MSRNATLRASASLHSHATTWEWRDGEWVPDGAPAGRRSPLLRVLGWAAALAVGTSMLLIGGMLFLAATLTAVPIALWLRFQSRRSRFFCSNSSRPISPRA